MSTRSYSDAVINNTSTTTVIKKENTATIIVKPRKQQNSDETKRDIQSKINPAKVQVGILATRNINKGGIIIKTNDNESAKKLV